jgi:hypothetical protein
MVRTIDGMVQGLDNFVASAVLDRMDQLFEYRHVGARDSSFMEARYAEARAKAESCGGLVYEFAYIWNQTGDVEAEARRKGRHGFFGMVVAFSDEDLRNRLALYEVMTS